MTNNGRVSVTITSLSDDKFGTLTGDADCQLGTVLAVGASCEFKATFTIPPGAAGSTHTNVFTAKAEDSEGNEATDDDPEDVTYEDVLPSLTVTKTGNPTVVPETGGDVEFTYVVTNNGTVPVTITSLSDDKFGTLTGDADCQIGTVLAANGGFCEFKATFTIPPGTAGSTHVNTFTAKAVDVDQNEVTASDPETVTYEDVLPSIIVTKTANPTSVPEAGGAVTFTYVVTNNGRVSVTITSLSDDKFGTLTGDADCQVGTVLAAGASCSFDALFNVPPGSYPGSHVNLFTAKAVDNEQNPVEDDDPAEVFYQEPPVTNVCPVNAAANRWTDIIGVGMGAPNKHKNVAKISIPNSGDVLALYGQLAAKDQGLPKYVRFMYPGKNNYVQVNTITSPSPHSAAVFWYGTELDPAANIRGRWFLQPTGAKKHIPRAFVLYPTYETDELYVDVFEPLQTSDTQVYWDINGGWVPMQQVTINIPAPLAPATIKVKVAVVDNDKDGRPLFVTATAGGVSQTLQPTDPNRGDQLNILEFTLVNVPAGTSSVVLTHESIAPGSNELFPLGGDSGALIGVTASYFCADVP